jgi:hypothetical protein
MAATGEEDNLGSSNAQNFLRKRNRQKNEEPKSQHIAQEGRGILSQEERSTIIQNVFLVVILLLLLITLWYFYMYNRTTTITVNFDKNYNSSIYGMCILSDTLLIAADNENKSIKVINTKDQRLVTTFYTESDPWSVTKVTDSKIAVSLSNVEKIQLISVNKEPDSDEVLLTIDNNITVNGKPIGIEYLDGKLYVVIPNSEIEPGIYIMTLDGTVIQNITRDSTGDQLFLFPLFIALNKQTYIMHVSDIGNNFITSLTLDGKVDFVYRDDNILQMPGMDVDGLGRVYVCRQNSNDDIFEDNPHDVIRLSAYYRVKSIVLAKKRNIKFPISVAYDDKIKRLYVGSKDSDVIQFFTIL